MKVITQMSDYQYRLTCMIPVNNSGEKLDVFPWNHSYRGVQRNDTVLFHTATNMTCDGARFIS